MTYDYQFHINGLKGIKPCLQSLLLVNNYEGMGETDAKEIGEMIDAAIEALEKQIPKKPKPHEDDEFSAKCPTCCDEVDTHWVHGGIYYCPYCGQAIDWSDDE